MISAECPRTTARADLSWTSNRRSLSVVVGPSGRILTTASTGASRRKPICGLPVNGGTLGMMPVALGGARRKRQRLRHNIWEFDPGATDVVPSHASPGGVDAVVTGRESGLPVEGGSRVYSSICFPRCSCVQLVGLPARVRQVACTAWPHPFSVWDVGSIGWTLILGRCGNGPCPLLLFPLGCGLSTQ